MAFSLKKKRLFFRVTKFQKPIVSLFTFTCLLMIAALALCASYLYYDTTNTLINAPGTEVPQLKMTVLMVLMILPLLFLIVIVIAYNISNKLVGAFERILRELDEVISERKKKHLSARQGDTLAEELLKRINVLIERMS